MSLKAKMLALLSAGAFLSSSAFTMEYVVKVEDGTSLESAIKDIEKKGAKVVDRHDHGRLLLVKTADSSQKKASVLNMLKASPKVAYTVENIKLHTFGTPNDPDFTQQWSLAKVKAENAWDQTVGSKDVTVAVIDTGIDWRHEDLASNIWQNKKEIPSNGIDDDNNGFVDDVRGWDFHGNDADPMDETSAQNPGHGTHCAGIVGAIGNNGKGISGMAQKLTLMPVRFLGSDGSGDLLAAAKAIDYAVLNGAKVISASWGATVPRSQVEPILEAIQRAGEAGVIFVAAAANDGRNNDSRDVYPANAGFPNVISVAASDSADNKPSWSNYGAAKVDVASPGADIYSTLPQNQYGNLSGTSMATPLVSGLVGMMVSEAIRLGRTYETIDYKAILQATGTETQIETACNCRVEAAAALKNIANAELTVVPNGLSVGENETVMFKAIGGEAPYTFKSSDPSIATITEAGEFKSLAKGDVVVSVMDAKQTEASSRILHVGVEAAEEPNECPLKSELLCAILCVVQPELPWCEM